MDKLDIERLLSRLNAGEATSADWDEAGRLIEAGAILPEDIETFQELHVLMRRMETPPPSVALDHRFYDMLSAEKRRTALPAWRGWFTWPVLWPRIALASVTLLVGMAAGYFAGLGRGNSGEQIERLSTQVSDLQEMMMLSLLEKGSTTERLKAVNLTQEMNEASRKVTAALIRTLNEDENVNVRLAALEALKPYAADSGVRESLIRSIARQESPLVQVSLAELMVALQEKSAVKEFEKLFESDKTPPDVKKKIQESINVLI